MSPGNAFGDVFQGEVRERHVDREHAVAVLAVERLGAEDVQDSHQLFAACLALGGLVAGEIPVAVGRQKRQLLVPNQVFCQELNKIVGLPGVSDVLDSMVDVHDVLAAGVLQGSMRVEHFYDCFEPVGARYGSNIFAGGDTQKIVESNTFKGKHGLAQELIFAGLVSYLEDEVHGHGAQLVRGFGVEKGRLG